MGHRFHVSTGRRPTTSNLESLQKGLDEDEEQIEERQCRDSLGEFVQVFMANRQLLVIKGLKNIDMEETHFSIVGFDEYCFPKAG